MNPLHALPSYFFKIYINIILPSMSSLSTCFPYFSSPPYHGKHSSPHPQPQYVLHEQPSHPSPFDHPKIPAQGAQIMKSPLHELMHSSIPYSLSLRYSLNVLDGVSHSYTMAQIINITFVYYATPCTLVGR